MKISNKKLNPVVTELFIKDRKSNISLVFITQSCFAVPKTLDQILHIISLRKFQANNNFSKQLWDMEYEI